MGYLKRERNYLPWVVALDAFKIIIGLLEAEEGDSNAGERKEVYARFKRWVITLMMPYFCENGYADDLDATEEQKYLKTKMREFSCEQLDHKPCVNFENKWLKKPPKPIIDEEYCDQIIPIIVHQSDIDIDVALDVLEGCSSQVIKSPDRVEFMAKLTSKVKTGKEVKRLKEWEKKDDRSCPRGLQCYGYKWARRMIEQVGMKEEARGKCREMVFQTIKRVGGVGNNEGTLRNPRAPKKRLKTSVIRFSQVPRSRSCFQLLPPCPPHTNTSVLKSASTASPMEISKTCVIQNVSWHLGWRLIMEKGQKSLWKKSSSSTGQILTRAGPKT